MIYPHKQLRVLRELENRLIANKHKGNSWQTCHVSILFSKLQEEYAEVVLDTYNPKELADLSNICNMLIWRFSK